MPSTLSSASASSSRLSSSSSSSSPLFSQRQQQGHARRRHLSRTIITNAVKRKNEKHVVCSKTLVAAPGKEDAVDAACSELVAAFGLSGPKATPATAAAAKRRGVIEFTYGRDSYEPNVFHFWERYDSNVSLGRHNTRDEVVAFMERLQRDGLLQGPVGMVLYEWRDGHLGPASAQGGPKGEGGLDDATGGSGMAGGAGLKQTSATLDLGNIERGEEGDSFGMDKVASAKSKSAEVESKQDAVSSAMTGVEAWGKDVEKMVSDFTELFSGKKK